MKAFSLTVRGNGDACLNFNEVLAHFNEKKQSKLNKKE